MSRKRAKTLTPEQFQTLLADIDANSPMPVRDRLIALLSFRAGLRAAEIAKIKISHMTDAEGRIGKVIHVYSHVGKKARERDIPMHPDIKQALGTFMKAYPGTDTITISWQTFRYRSKIIPGRTAKDVPMKPMTPNAVTKVMTKLYTRLFTGTSSHSGRRTFGTILARRCGEDTNTSLRDVQRLLGHASLNTTENYIDMSENVGDLVCSW